MVDRHAAEDERHAVAERVRVDAETDAEARLRHATDANAPGSSASDSIAIAPGGVAWSLPHGPRRRWTATSPAASAGRASLSARSPTYATSAAGRRRCSTSRSKNARSGLRTPRLAEPVTTSTGSSDERAHSSSAAVWFPATPTNSAGGAQRARGSRARPDRGRRSSRRPIPTRPAGRSTPRWRQSSQCSSSARDRHAERRPHDVRAEPGRRRRRRASTAPRRRGSPRRRRRPRARSWPAPRRGAGRRARGRPRSSP